MEYSDIWILMDVANWARTPPMLLPVEPLPCELSRSMTRTLRQPAVVRWYATLDPTIPPPTITTSAVTICTMILFGNNATAGQKLPISRLDQIPEIKRWQRSALNELLRFGGSFQGHG